MDTTLNMIYLDHKIFVHASNLYLVIMFGMVIDLHIWCSLFMCLHLMILCNLKN